MSLGHWPNFYITVGGAAAALTGLIFVAVSLHASTVLGNTLHRDRAWSSVALLMSVVFVSMALLAPDQPTWLIGLELDAIAAFWVYRTTFALVRLSPAMRAADRPFARWLFEWIVWIAWLVALVAGAIAITAGYSIGLPLVAAAAAGMIGMGIWSAWVLISEPAS
jgi:hypothetical protein